MPANDEIADGLAELETEFPATFIWDSGSYIAIVSGETRASSISEFGMEHDDELSLVVRVAQFGTGPKPQQRQRITYNSRQYRIESISTAPQNAFVVYRCIRDNGTD